MYLIRELIHRTVKIGALFGVLNQKKKIKNEKYKVKEHGLILVIAFGLANTVFGSLVCVFLGCQNEIENCILHRSVSNEI